MKNQKISLLAGPSPRLSSVSVQARTAGRTVKPGKNCWENSQTPQKVSDRLQKGSEQWKCCDRNSLLKV